MDKKRKIILLVSMLSIFLIGIIVIFTIKMTKKDEIEEQPSLEHSYAQNETRDRTDVEENEIDETQNVLVGYNSTIYSIDRLTPEQNAAKSDMKQIFDERVANDIRIHGDIISAEVTDSSDKYHVFIDVSFSDGTYEIYVINYDATSSHKFLRRCMTLEEWEYYNSEQNLG